ncbi:MAG: FAD-binding protein [Saprospiraceae bacterium]|nr:FAD-binding protein [Saprospiraceae bacterium]
MRIRKNAPWSNVSKLHGVTPFLTFDPGSLEEICEAVRDAEVSNVRIRAVGSGHSPSDIAVTDGYLISTHKLTNVLPLDTLQLQASVDPTSLINLGAGITIKALNRYLEQKDLALLNMGAIDAQTIVGAISKGTHGTGREQISMPGMVRSMVLVAAHGKIYRVEPSNGITDPDKHTETSIELIQNDDFFYSLLINLGVMGIIYSVIIEVRPIYWLLEKRHITKWSNLRKDLSSQKLFEPEIVEITGTNKEHLARGITVMINPHKVGGDHLCMLSKIFEVEQPEGHLRPKGRSKLSKFLSDLPISYWTYLWVVRNRPKLVPKLLNLVIKSTSSQILDLSHRVLHAGSAYIQNKSSSCEFGYRIDQEGYLKTVEDLFVKSSELANLYSLYSSIPIGLRFTKASKAYLSPEFGHNVCYVVTPALVEQPGFKLLLNSFQEIHIRNGGKPHWAKITNRIDGRIDLLQKWYPKLETWIDVMRHFNPDDTFSNGFSDRLGLTTSLARKSYLLN